MPFTSAWAKLARAEEHRKVIEPEIKAFVESKPVVFGSQHNLEATEGPILFVYSVKTIRTAPESWSLIAGDAIQNIRAALDHVVYALVVKQKGAQFAEANAPKIAFPIADKASSFPGTHLAKIGLTAPVVAVIENAQPYIRQQNAPRDDALWVIRALSNVDKHRLLHVITLIPEKVEITTAPHLGDGVVEFLTPGALYKGAKVVRFTAQGRPPAHTEVKVNAEFAVGISIDATTETKALPVDTGLRAMRDRVVEIVNAITAVAYPRRKRTK